MHWAPACIYLWLLSLICAQWPCKLMYVNNNVLSLNETGVLSAQHRDNLARGQRRVSVAIVWLIMEQEPSWLPTQNIMVAISRPTYTWLVNTSAGALDSGHNCWTAWQTALLHVLRKVVMIYIFSFSILSQTRVCLVVQGWATIRGLFQGHSSSAAHIVKTRCAERCCCSSAKTKQYVNHTSTSFFKTVIPNISSFSPYKRSTNI